MVRSVNAIDWSCMEILFIFECKVYGRSFAYYHEMPGKWDVCVCVCAKRQTEWMKLPWLLYRNVNYVADSFVWRYCSVFQLDYIRWVSIDNSVFMWISNIDILHYTRISILLWKSCMFCVFHEMMSFSILYTIHVTVIFMQYGWRVERIKNWKRTMFDFLTLKKCAVKSSGSHFLFP